MIWPFSRGGDSHEHDFEHLRDRPAGVNIDLENDELVVFTREVHACKECGDMEWRSGSKRRYRLDEARSEDLSSCGP